MRRKLSSWLALFTLSCVVATPGMAQSQPAKAQDTANTPTLVELTFNGGTAAEYVEAVKAAAGRTGGDVNVVAGPELSNVSVPRIQLRNVSVGSALAILQNMSGESSGAKFQLICETLPTEFTDESPVIKINAIDARLRVRPPTDPGPTSHVWTISSLVESGLKIEDVLTAIETALSLSDDGAAEPKLRVHKESGLLLGRGNEEQMATIDQVISSLEAGRMRISPQVNTAELHQTAVKAVEAAKQSAADAERMRVRLEMLQQETQLRLDRLADAEAELIRLRASVLDLRSQLSATGNRPAETPR